MTSGEWSLSTRIAPGTDTLGMHHSAAISGPYSTEHLLRDLHEETPQSIAVVCNGVCGTFLVEDQVVLCGCAACTSTLPPDVAAPPVPVPVLLQHQAGISPTEFERHAGMGATRKWRHSIKVVPPGTTTTGVPRVLSIGKWLESQPSASRVPPTSGRAQAGSSSPLSSPRASALRLPTDVVDDACLTPSTVATAPDTPPDTAPASAATTLPGQRALATAPYPAQNISPASTATISPGQRALAMAPEPAQNIVPASTAAAIPGHSAQTLQHRRGSWPGLPNSLASAVAGVQTIDPPPVAWPQPWLDTTARPVAGQPPILTPSSLAASSISQPGITCGTSAEVPIISGPVEAFTDDDMGWAQLVAGCHYGCSEQSMGYGGGGGGAIHLVEGKPNMIHATEDCGIPALNLITPNNLCQLSCRAPSPLAAAPPPPTQQPSVPDGAAAVALLEETSGGHQPAWVASPCAGLGHDEPATLHQGPTQQWVHARPFSITRVSTAALSPPPVARHLKQGIAGATAIATQPVTAGPTNPADGPQAKPLPCPAGQISNTAAEQRNLQDFDQALVASPLEPGVWQSPTAAPNGFSTPHTSSNDPATAAWGVAADDKPVVCQWQVLSSQPASGQATLCQVTGSATPTDADASHLQLSVTFNGSLYSGTLTLKSSSMGRATAAWEAAPASLKQGREGQHPGSSSKPNDSRSSSQLDAFITEGLAGPSIASGKRSWAGADAAFPDPAPGRGWAGTGRGAPAPGIQGPAVLTGDQLGSQAGAARAVTDSAAPAVGQATPARVLTAAGCTGKGTLSHPPQLALTTAAEGELHDTGSSSSGSSSTTQEQHAGVQRMPHCPGQAAWQGNGREVTPGPPPTLPSLHPALHPTTTLHLHPQPVPPAQATATAALPDETPSFFSAPGGGDHSGAAVPSSGLVLPCQAATSAAQLHMPSMATEAAAAAAAAPVAQVPLTAAAAEQVHQECDQKVLDMSEITCSLGGSSSICRGLSLSTGQGSFLNALLDVSLSEDPMVWDTATNIGEMHQRELQQWSEGSQVHTYQHQPLHCEKQPVPASGAALQAQYGCHTHHLAPGPSHISDELLPQLQRHSGSCHQEPGSCHQQWREFPAHNSAAFINGPSNKKPRVEPPVLLNTGLVGPQDASLTSNRGPTAATRRSTSGRQSQHREHHSRTMGSAALTRRKRSRARHSVRPQGAADAGPSGAAGEAAAGMHAGVAKSGGIEGQATCHAGIHCPTVEMVHSAEAGLPCQQPFYPPQLAGSSSEAAAAARPKHAKRAGRCSVCVVQRKGKCGTESAPWKCLKRQASLLLVEVQADQGGGTLLPEGL